MEKSISLQPECDQWQYKKQEDFDFRSFLDDCENEDILLCASQLKRSSKMKFLVMQFSKLFKNQAKVYVVWPYKVFFLDLSRMKAAFSHHRFWITRQIGDVASFF